MTVAELIEELKNHDQTRLVLTRGYEGGWEESSQVEDVEVALNVYHQWYYGPHKEVSETDQYDGKARAIAITIS